MRNKSASTSHHPKGSDWAHNEFAAAQLPDQRLRPRLHMIATDFANQPTAAIPQACGSCPRAKGAYRFFSNDAIEPAAIREPHHQATLQRLRQYPLVLAIQDTTTLNYSTHPATRGLGPIGSHSPKTIGLHLHSTLIVVPKGQPLGFAHNAVRARPKRRATRSRHQRNLADKESHKWVESLEACQQLAPLCPDTQIVTVADREGDLYELFLQAQSAPPSARVHLLVRSRHNRKVKDHTSSLWEVVAHQRVAATLTVRVGRKGEQPSRLATLSVRFCALQLQAPARQANQPAVQVWAVEAREVRPPKGVEPIQWHLLSTLPVTNGQEAVQRVGWYALRWQIEVIHKILKSGCKVEQRQLQTAARLERVLSVDLVVAWRILALCKAARELPDDPVSNWLPTAQWQTLWCHEHQRTDPPKTAPSVRQAVRWIAKLGGFLGRKSDGEPGTITLWRGLEQLQAMTKMWVLCHKKNRR